MRTVRFNRRAVAFAALIAGAVLVLTVSHIRASVTTRLLPDAPVDEGAVARDVLNRRKAEEQAAAAQHAAEPPAPAAVDVAEPKKDAREHEEVIEEPRKNPELSEGKPPADPLILFGCLDANNAGEAHEPDVDHADQSKLAAAPAAHDEEEKPAVVPEPAKPKALDLENVERREFVKRMTLHGWHNYANLTWGKNELKPLARMAHSQPIFGGEKMGATIVDGADTLYIMQLREEYEHAREFIKDNFTIKAAGQLSTFETTIRFLGGFLSLYALTSDPLYIEKATEVADALLPAFNTKTGIAKSLVNVKTKQASNYGWVLGSGSILSEFGSLHLEFVYLSELTGNPLYRHKFIGSHISIGALGDSFYEYLIKGYVQSGKEDKQAYQMYKNVSRAIRQKMVFTSKSGLKYVAELRNGVPEHKDGASRLASAPGYLEQDPQEKREIMELAEALGHTCHESYVRSATGIGPEMFYFKDEDDATSKSGENGYILRPEAIEGWFLPVATHPEAQIPRMGAIEKHCRTENGYAGLRNVYEPEAGHDDVQQSYFFAETLKYAYLTFADDEIKLNQWVFNTEAHPFPVGYANMQPLAVAAAKHR
ncbi:Alpha-1,2-Mannosidase [Aphelenchoides fujianensis]|nr:Alpha-1,2-Mannosidase [Aphelenchoides fujianensis]